MSDRRNTFSYSLPENLESALQAQIEDWKKHDKIFRLWTKDASLWSNEDEAKWLGWLDAVGAELCKIDEYLAFAEDAKQFDDVVLLGMGGSSLCPEVFAITFGVKNFHVLDSTVPAQVKALEDKLDLAKTLFIVASKSGSTLEPNCFKQYFYERVAETVGRENAGRHFVAITDPGSKMQMVAERDGFRKTFLGNPEIGGRFSALSPFGMAAAASMQIDVKEFLGRANEMVHACKSHSVQDNSGVMLGLILGICHAAGKDKLTIFTSPGIYDLGAWLEQLIAESTGKNGVAIIPVDREEMQANYGKDRIFVSLAVEGEEAASLDALESAGHPVIRIMLADKMNLGQEFFRWEVATAVAGSVMGINPFNQPDVESAKIEARKITEEYEATGSLPDETPFFESDGVKLFTDAANEAELRKLAGDGADLRSFLKAHLARITENDYFALLAYIEMNGETEKVLQNIRHTVLSNYNVSTCLGFGPRFLHSTGQAYKGGANNGVFLQITSDDETDLCVPNQKYTFGVVKAAQARGDFQVLVDRGRRALRIHIGGNLDSGLKQLEAAI